jgi:hypothetical protein
MLNRFVKAVVILICALISLSIVLGSPNPTSARSLAILATTILVGFVLIRTKGEQAERPENVQDRTRHNKLILIGLGIGFGVPVAIYILLRMTHP